MELTKRDVLEEIPRFKRDGESRVRPDFKDLYRIVASHKLEPHELDFFRREIIARKELLGIKPPKHAPRRSMF